MVDALWSYLALPSGMGTQSGGYVVVVSLAHSPFLPLHVGYQGLFCLCLLAVLQTIKETKKRRESCGSQACGRNACASCVSKKLRGQRLFCFKGLIASLNQKIPSSF